MTEKQAHEAIAQRFKSQWSSMHAGMPIAFANEVGSTSSEWIRLTFVPAVSRQSAIGAVRRWTREGTIGVQIFTLAADGTGRASELADDVRTALEGQYLTVAGESEPVVTYGGASGSPLAEGAWFQLTVTFPYHFDELRA